LRIGDVPGGPVANSGMKDVCGQNVLKNRLTGKSMLFVATCKTPAAENS
jgi:hypothetical protein